MSQDKLEGLNSQKLSADVYDNATKFNFQLAVKGPAILYALSKASEQAVNPQLVTGVGGFVIGALSFFGNRYYRSKGDDSANSYMGLMMGGVQGASGLLLIVLEACKGCLGDPDSDNNFATMTQTGAMALSLGLACLMLVNSFLYGEGPKSGMVSKMGMG